MKRKAFNDHFTTISQHILRPLLHFLLWIKTSVIRQKSEFQNGYLKKTKHATFSRKQTFLTPWYAHVRMHIREAIKVRFSVGMLCFVVFFGIFFEISVLRFAFLPYYRRKLIIAIAADDLMLTWKNQKFTPVILRKKFPYSELFWSVFSCI